MSHATPAKLSLATDHRALFSVVVSSWTAAKPFQSFLGIWQGLAIDTEDAKRLASSALWTQELVKAKAEAFFRVKEVPRYILCDGSWTSRALPYPSVRWAFDLGTDSMLAAHVMDSEAIAKHLTPAEAEALAQDLHDKGVIKGFDDLGLVASARADLPAWALQGSSAVATPPVAQPLGLDAAVAALQRAASGRELDKSLFYSAVDGLVSLSTKVRAYNDRLNEREVAPTGDDYNEVLSLVLH